MSQAIRPILLARRAGLAFVAAGALVACGGGDKSSAPSDAAVKPADARAASTNAGTPLDKPFRFKGGEAFDFDAVLALLPEELRPTYKDASFDKKLGAMVVTDLTFAPQLDAAVGDKTLSLQDEGFTVGRAELYGLDQDALKRVAEADGLEGDARYEAPFESVFEKVRLFDIREVVKDGEEAADKPAIGALELDKLAIRRGALEGVDVETEEEANAAHFFNAFSLAGLYVKDAALDAGDVENDDVRVRIAAPDMRLVGLGGGKLGAFIAKDLSYSLEQSQDALEAVSQTFGADILKGPLSSFIAPQSQGYEVASVDWRDIDFSGLMPFGLAGERPPVSERKLIDLGSVTVKDTETFVNGKLLSSTPEATVSAMEFTWLAPSRIVSSAPKATYDFTAYLKEEEADAIATFKKYGLDNVTGSSDFTYLWDADKGDASLASDFKAKDFSNFDFSLGLAGLGLDKMEDGENFNIASLLESGALSSVELVLDDEKMLDAGFAIAAMQSGGKPEDLRSSASALLRVGGMQFMMMNPKFGDYVNALASFVDDGGKLTIKAAPKEPVPFAELAAGDPTSAPTLLNLTVERSE